MMRELKVTKSEKDAASSKIMDGELETLLARSELGNDGVSTAMESLSTSETINAASPMETEELITHGPMSVHHKYNKLIQARIKQIKPLLTVSSKLGRALAELFGLLVKLSVGSPTRQRRTQQLTNTVTTPTPAARAVATSLAGLLNRGLSWFPPYYSPVSKLR